MTSRRAVRRRARQNKSPAKLVSILSKYLTTNTTTRIFPMPAQGLPFEVVCTATVRVVFNSGVGANGITIPENPNRSITQFGGSTINQNTSMAKYQQLFDEMCVKAIIVEYQPGNPYGIGNNYVEFAALCDYDSEIGAGALTTPLSAMQYTTARCLSHSSESQLVFQPTAQRSFPKWFTTVDTSARGCVYYRLDCGGGQFYVGNLTIKYVLQMRNPIA